MEAGYAETDGTVTAYLIDYPYTYYVDVDSDLTFVPVELNLKYAIRATPYFTIDFGAGVSYNYVEEELSALGLSISEDDWLFGGQFFVVIRRAIPWDVMGGVARRAWARNEASIETCIQYNKLRCGAEHINAAVSGGRGNARRAGGEGVHGA